MDAKEREAFIKKLSELNDVIYDFTGGIYVEHTFNSEEDLVQKLEKGIISTNSGNVHSLEEAMLGVHKILSE